MNDLYVVFTELYENEHDAKAFIVKLKEMQRKAVLAILGKHHRMANMGTSFGEGSMQGGN